MTRDQVTRDKADRVFAENVLALFREGGLEVETLTNEGESHFELEIRIPRLGSVGFKLTCTTRSQSRTEYDPDPRMFGDTQEVTARAMQGWYPGKTNSWTEKKRVVVLQGWNLPKIGNYSATYNYDAAYTSSYGVQATVEGILNLLRNYLREAAAQERRAKEDLYAKQVADAFSRLRKK